MSDDFITLIQNNIKSSIITAWIPEDTLTSGTFVANNTALKSVIHCITAQLQFAVTRMIINFGKHAVILVAFNV